MGIVREPEGVDFIIAGGSMKAENAALVSEWLQAHRAARIARLEEAVLALPIIERSNLLHRHVDSLTRPVPAEPTPTVASKPRTSSHAEPKSKQPRTAKARVSS